MHVIELLPEFATGVDIEVVIAPLPEAARVRRLLRKRQRQLRLGSSFLAAKFSGNALFEDLDRLGGSRSGRFTDEQVEVVGH